MKNDDERALTPRLRFPEFRDREAWTLEPMEHLYSFMRNNAFSRDKLNYERGSVKNIHYGDIHTKFQTLFDITQESVPYINDTEPLPPSGSDDYCVEGDLIFADASEDTNDVGKSIEIVRLNGERLLSGQHTILARRNDKKLVLGFGGYLFKSRRIRSQIIKESQGTKVYAISATRLGDIEVAFPADEKEQQKIADCLTSLDEVIAAQGRKVEALKAHKKVLMQQLFPREGETIPRVRFPAFQQPDNWTIKKIGDFAKVTTGDKDTQNRIENGDYPFFVRSQNIERIDTFAYDGEAVLTSGDGVGVGENYHYINGRFNFHQRVYCIFDFAPDASAQYFFLYFSEHFKSRVKQLSAKNSVDSVRMPMITQMPIWFPSLSEQRAIASCLFALEDQIAAQSQKLDALKTHKKALMQQLFPSPEGP
jgi:type I restriction enzyme S subunit